MNLTNPFSLTPGIITNEYLAGPRIDTRLFTASGSYTPSIYCRSIEIYVVGGGGGGGAAPFTTGILASAGAGGGAGTIYHGWYSELSSFSFPATVTIGAGGAGGTTGTGTAGGRTYFGSISADGGDGGASVSLSTNGYAHTPGSGAPLGYSILSYYTPAISGPAWVLAQSGKYVAGMSGAGASGMMYQEGGNTVSLPGDGGNGGYGGGGGGAFNPGGTVAHNGGNGGDGFVIVVEYY